MSTAHEGIVEKHLRQGTSRAAGKTAPRLLTPRRLSRRLVPASPVKTVWSSFAPVWPFEAIVAASLRSFLGWRLLQWPAAPHRAPSNFRARKSNLSGLTSGWGVGARP